MKKITALFLSAFFLLLSVGVSGSIHFCGGKPRKISFFSEHESCCKKAVNMRCCRNESFSVKLEDDFVKDSRTASFTGNDFHQLSDFSNALFGISPLPDGVAASGKLFHPPCRSVPLLALSQSFRL